MYKYAVCAMACRYVSILVELTRIEGTRHGKLIAGQMLDVAIRVQAIRPFAVSQMVRHANSVISCVLCREGYLQDKGVTDVWWFVCRPFC